MRQIACHPCNAGTTETVNMATGLFQITMTKIQVYWLSLHIKEDRQITLIQIDDMQQALVDTLLCPVL